MGQNEDLVTGDGGGGVEARHLKMRGGSRMGAAPHRLTWSSDRTDLLGLRTLRAPTRGVLHPLVVLKAAVPVNLDGGVVDEDVGGAVVWGDETIALVRVKPLHCSLSHCASPTRT